MRINLTEVEDRSFEAIPAGRYHLALVNFEMREVKGGGKVPAGTPMINWEFNVVSDAKTGDTKYQNRKVWMNTVLTDSALFNLKALLRATGKYSDEDLSSEIDFDPEDIMDTQMVGVISQREYNGDTVNDIKRVLPLSDKAIEESSLLP
jgi:hypothetical protein